MKKLLPLGLLMVISCCMLIPATAQEIPSASVIPVNELQNFLTREAKKKITKGKVVSNAELAGYFRTEFSKNFFYDWKTVGQRFEAYNQLYGNQKRHIRRAEDHLAKYADSTQWVLPFNYQFGEPVNAYALRHLARQHKMVDIAFLYFYENKDPQYIHYFTRQMQSLNAALVKGEYEKIEDGNGVYEVFRSGYRVLNWLTIHNMFLGQEAYTDEDQLYTIATLLQHGQHLYERNSQFRSGNHQTRGMSALAMLSMLFRDFEGTDLWYERAMKRLGEHLDKEINDDGFQFERSVHYHISDISNYFYVYQLAKISGIEIDAAWEEQLKSLFETLVKIAYPSKTTPVLQDDTDAPWAEENEIAGTMTLGYLLFNNPTYGYFAANKVGDRLYWFLQNRQLEMLNSIDQKRPKYKSLHFPETGYYIMREGWNPKHKMMIVTAGLDDKKPDHQHADMLGIQAYANGNILLPNYQVRYSLPDFDFFKNSMVKNVALVDEELQGKQWTSNKGGSGFGKFKSLPHPKVITWKSMDNLDLFVGSHDGFSNIGVDYTRQVIYLKHDFWVVKDNFKSASNHDYKQVWQGHYTDENGPELLRSTFPNGSGFDIFQLTTPDDIVQSGKRGKEWVVLTKKDQTTYEYITIIFPFSTYDKRIDETKENHVLEGWAVDKLPFDAVAKHSLSQKNEAILFGVKQLEMNGASLVFEQKSDIHFQWTKEKLVIMSIGDSLINLEFTKADDPKKITFNPGEIIVLD
ncbi:MAG: heparinase [Bacteroidetes bacterium]|nr:MAG: heparinase [Bacteroidota bacterium]